MFCIISYSPFFPVPVLVPQFQSQNEPVCDCTMTPWGSTKLIILTGLVVEFVDTVVVHIQHTCNIHLHLVLIDFLDLDGYSCHHIVVCKMKSNNLSSKLVKSLKLKHHSEGKWWNNQAELTALLAEFEDRLLLNWGQDSKCFLKHHIPREQLGLVRCTKLSTDPHRTPNFESLRRNRSKNYKSS